MGKVIFRGFRKSPPVDQPSISIVFGANLKTSTERKSPKPRAVTRRAKDKHSTPEE